MKSSFMVAHGLRRVWMCAAVAAHSHAEHATPGPTPATAAHGAGDSSSMQTSAVEQLRRQLSNARTQVDSLNERLAAVQHEAHSWQTAWEKRKYKHEVSLRDLQQLRMQRKQLQEQVGQLEQQLAACQTGIASLVSTCEPFLVGPEATTGQAAIAHGSSPDQVLEAVESALKEHLQQQQQQQQQVAAGGGALRSLAAKQEQQPAVQDQEAPPVCEVYVRAPGGSPAGSTQCSATAASSLAVTGPCSDTIAASTTSNSSSGNSSSNSNTCAAVSPAQAPVGGCDDVAQPAALAADTEVQGQHVLQAAFTSQPAMAHLQAQTQALLQANQGLQQQLDAAAATHSGLRKQATGLMQQLMEQTAAKEALQQQVLLLRASSQQAARAGRAGAAVLAVAGVAYLHWCEGQLSVARSNAAVLQDRYHQLAQQLHGIDTTTAAALVSSRCGD